MKRVILELNQSVKTLDGQDFGTAAQILAVALERTELENAIKWSEASKTLYLEGQIELDESDLRQLKEIVSEKLKLLVFARAPIERGIDKALDELKKKVDL